MNHKLLLSPVPDPNAWDIDALNINWTGLTAYAYPPTALLHRVIQKISQCHCLIIVIAPGWPGDALVLGPSAALYRDPTSTSSVSNSSQTVPQLCAPQQSTTSQPPRLVSRSGQLQEQGFSTATVKQVSDFFMYLYQDLNRCPLTIDGYRTAIVDTLGPAGHHISQSSDLHRLLSSFHRDHPNSSRNLPEWNLSVILNELTTAPFEPMKDTDLKHITLKTAFLLALASGKRCSEIHAWVIKNLIWANGKRLPCSLLLTL